MHETRKYIRTFITITLLILSTSIQAQSYLFESLSANNGLSDQVINAIYKDQAGSMWIGTGNSLAKYDGIHLKNYLIPGSNEKLKRVNTIAESPTGSIWIGNGVGLWRLTKENDKLERIIPEEISAGVYSLLTDNQGTLYIGGESGLTICKDGQFRTYLLEGNLFSGWNTITGMVIEENRILWMSTLRGLVSFNLTTEEKEFYNKENEQSNQNSFHSIAQVGNRLYLGTMNQGILSFDTTNKTFKSFVDVGCNVISDLSSDSTETLYVATDGNGVHFINTTTEKIIQSFRHKAGSTEGIRSNSVYSLLVDRDGLIWIGFYQMGLDYTLYQNGVFNSYSYKDLFDSKDMSIRTLSINGEEKLIGSRDGLHFIDEKRKKHIKYTIPTLRSSMIICSYYYQKEYYIGTYGGGMYVFNPTTLTIRDFNPTEEEPFIKGQIFSITSDRENQLWIGTSAGLYVYREGKIITKFTSSNSKLPEGNIYKIFFDSTHKGWICTENGMCIWEPSSRSLKTDIFPEGFIDKEKIRVIYEDSNHDLYFLPDKGAMFISNLAINRFKRISLGTPLDGKDGLFIVEDSNHWLWIGTNNGIFRYDKKDTFISYNFVDGIPNPTFTYCEPVVDKEGKIWMGNSKGLIYIDPLKEKKKSSFYPITFWSFYANGNQPITTIESENGEIEIKLKESQRNLIIQFSSLTYTKSNSINYEYRLEGENKEWTLLEGKSEVAYYDLPAGKYRFHVRLVNQPESEVWAIIKVPHPIERWASILGATLLVITFGSYWKYRRSSKKRSYTKKEEENESREIRVVNSVRLDELELTNKKELLINSQKYKSNKVSLQECQILARKLEQVMKKKKPYTNPNLKIAHLAELLNTTPHTLSYLFSQHLNCTYYDYINDYRITEFKQLANDDEYIKYTLDALAELCGFSSRASFFRHFKKATNTTPNEYIRSLDR